MEQPSAVPKRKTRMLSIRLSEDEYENLRSAYSANGNRSVSDLARDALHRGIAHQSEHSAARADSAGGNPADVHTTVRALDQKIDVLQSEVSKLSRALSDRTHSNEKD